MAGKRTEDTASERSGSVAGMEDNLKKAVAEMLVLHLLNEREMYIGEIPEELERRSGGAFHIVFPYSVIYRLVKFAYIDELHKRIAPDGRKRQYYTITDRGRGYLRELCAMFERFSAGVTTIMQSEGEPAAQATPAPTALGREQREACTQEEPARFRARLSEG